MRFLFIFFLTIIFHPVFCQVDEISQERLENLVERTEQQIENDDYFQQLEILRTHPLNLNVATENDLDGLMILNPVQIKNFLRYRSLLGKLKSIYELQAIPGWDIDLIRKLLPYVTINQDAGTKIDLLQRLKNGNRSFLITLSRIIEKEKGYSDTGRGRYLGSQLQAIIKYKYNYKNNLQFGFSGTKDAGEAFFRLGQKRCFDFYSFHFFIKNVGIIHSIAIGDFTVNLGQGLTQWQSLAFKKSTDVLAIKRQGEAIRPYNSSGEYNFHRGVAINFQRKKISSILFVSSRSLSSNLVKDTISGHQFVSSIITSGYHRSLHELETRNNLNLLTVGANISYTNSKLHAGLNSIHYNYSKPIQKAADPYNLFAFAGNRLTNISFDYNYTFRNIYLFGEIASDHELKTAILNGFLISLNKTASLSLLYRNISPAFKSFYGNAFTENSNPVNEKGFYAGISLHPSDAFRFDASFDLFHFPWLKYQVNAPSSGNHFLFHVSYQPHKKLALSVTFDSETKQLDDTGSVANFNQLMLSSKQIVKSKINWQASSNFFLNQNLYLIRASNKGSPPEKGFLLNNGFQYVPIKTWKISGGFEVFETDSYNSRVYSSEHDIRLSYSVPLFSDKGIRYLINLNMRARSSKSGRLQMPDMDFWLRWAQTIYKDKNSIGSGNNMIMGNKKSEIKFQMILSW